MGTTTTKCKKAFGRGAYPCPKTTALRSRLVRTRPRRRMAGRRRGAWSIL